MTLKSFAMLGAMLLTVTAAPAFAASTSGVEGEWLQKVTCRGRGTVFNHQMKIYRDGDALKFVANAPVLNTAPSDENPAFPSVYYGTAELDGDRLTLRVSDRYKREYQKASFTQSGQFVAQDAAYRLTPQGELIALGDSACEATPFRPVGRRG